VPFAGILRLVEDTGFATVIAKGCWRNLAARVAINATCVYEEFAFHVLREPLVDLRHCLLDSLWASGSHYYGLRLRF
jgi:hypothetical protein